MAFLPAPPLCGHPPRRVAATTPCRRGAPAGGATSRRRPPPPPSRPPSASAAEPLHEWRRFRAALISAEAAAATPTSGAGGGGCGGGGAHAGGTAAWAHSVATVETGGCLVASPAYPWALGRRYLAQAVVLVTEIGPDGVRGLIVNHEIGRCEAVKGIVGAEFRHNRLYLGGDVSLGTIAILHRRSSLLGAGAVEVCPGVFLGGFNASRAAVAASEAGAADFRFLRGYMRWSPEAMAAELADGAWRTVAAAPDVLLPPPVGDRVRRPGDGVGKPTRRGLWETLIASSAPPM